MRKPRVYKKFNNVDYKHKRADVNRFVNYVMKDGKKSIAERIVYSAFEKAQKEIGQGDMLEIFERAITNASPLLEVMSRRIGGANYQIPIEVRPERRFVLAARWIINAARNKKGKPMADKLAAELVAAYKNEGDAIKKKQEMHRVAEANRAFAHFAR